MREWSNPKEKEFFKTMLKIYNRKEKTLDQILDCFRDYDLPHEVKKRLFHQVKTSHHHIIKIGEDSICPVSRNEFIIWNDVRMKDLSHEGFLRILQQEMRKDLTGENTIKLLNIIHRNLFYFGVKSDTLLKYYKMEYLLSMVEKARLTGFPVQDYLQYLSIEFGEVLNDLTDNIVKTVEVWLLRELYYFKNNLLDYMGSENDVAIAIKYLYNGDLDNFRRVIIDNGVCDFGETNPDVYFNVFDVFSKSQCINKEARLNILINLSHCNGTMATKYINLSPNLRDRYRRENCPQIAFLTDLSEGFFINEVHSDFYRLTRIPLSLILKNKKTA